MVSNCFWKSRCQSLFLRPLNRDGDTDCQIVTVRLPKLLLSRKFGCFQLNNRSRSFNDNNDEGVFIPPTLNRQTDCVQFTFTYISLSTKSHLLINTFTYILSTNARFYSSDASTSASKWKVWGLRPTSDTWFSANRPLSVDRFALP